MTNSMNPNKGHFNPAPVITHPKTPAPAEPQGNKPASSVNGGRS